MSFLLCVSDQEMQGKGDEGKRREEKKRKERRGER